MLVLALLALVPDVAVGADSKAVTTTLTTKWPSTPLMLEARYISHIVSCNISFFQVLHDGIVNCLTESKRIVS